MASELVEIMRSHLRAESDLVAAMFVKKDAALAHEVNVKATALLQERKALIAVMRSHVEQDHGDDYSTEFTLQRYFLRLPRR